MALLKSAALAAGLCLATAPALAHVGAEPADAPAGAYQTISFRVGHGCGEAATTALRIELPQGLASARPQPKPGWTLGFEKLGDRPSAFTWRGDLPADQFDTFAILVKLPPAAGLIYFPVVQTCGAQESQWTQIPDPGEAAQALSHPAPALRVLPAVPHP